MKITLALLIIIPQLLYVSGAQQKVVCYWPNWNNHGGAFGHTPHDIDPTLCTHIHYAFALLDETHDAPKDSEGSPQVHVYQELNDLKKKNPDLKIILSIGGWGDKSSKYSHMVAKHESRAKFIHNAIEYLNKYHFDGLDIDWEFPVCWQAECNKGPAADKQNYIHLLEELHTAFSKNPSKKLSLSAAVNGGEDIGSKAYDVPALGKYLDYINVMTYDNAGEWEHKTGHHSAFEYCKNAVEFYVKHGAPKEKVLVGVPFYGHTFTLKDPKKHGIGAPITGVGKKFPSGDGDGANYLEICEAVKHKGWKKEQSSNGHDPIAYHGDQWVGYDDPNQAYQKSKWVKDNGYGGIIIWEISQDDVHKKCCSVNYPMLRAINYGLFGKGANPNTYGCE